MARWAESQTFQTQLEDSWAAPTISDLPLSTSARGTWIFLDLVSGMALATGEF